MVDFAALFHVVTLNRDWTFKASNKTQKQHKSSPYHSPEAIRWFCGRNTLEFKLFESNSVHKSNSYI